MKRKTYLVSELPRILNILAELSFSILIKCEIQFKKLTTKKKV